MITREDYNNTTSIIDPKTLKGGERVIYECDDEGYARWSGHDDYGESNHGRFIEAKIVYIGDLFFTTEASNGTEWHWSLPDSFDYSKDQWQRPGFVRLDLNPPQCKCSTKSHSVFCHLYNPRSRSVVRAKRRGTKT